MAKRNRFNFQHFKKLFPDVVIGWGAYSDYDVEEKVFFGPFVEASVYFHKKHESGDKKAIFTFVKNYPECFREVWTFPDGTTHTCYSNNNIFTREYGRSWVIEQIEKWKAEETAEARKKLKKLFNAYVGGHEEKCPDEDWKIYDQIKNLVNKGLKPSKAIRQIIDGTYGTALDPKLKSIIDRQLEKNSDIEAVITRAAKITGKSKIEIRSYAEMGAKHFNTYREIYYKLKKLEEKYVEDKEITEKNLRYNYFLPHKNMTIPKNYKDQFNEELSLFCAVEWERIGFISFPRINSELSIYTGTKHFKEWGKRISLKEALEKVSKEKNIPLSKLKEIYTNLQEIHAMYAGRDVLEVLKEV